jgi:hypothetical protein
MDQQAQQTFFQQVHDLWIEPELKRRQQEGRTPEGFKIWRSMIRLPQGRPAIVEFNDEINWMALVALSPSVTPKVGQPVYWDQVREFSSVEPPHVDGQRVAFVYVFKVTRGYSFIFDFSPNIPEDTLPVEQRPDWAQTFGAAIARTLQANLVERTVDVDEPMQQQLKSIGLWSAPALLPYPMGEIVRFVADGDLAGARAVLVRHCDASFLQALMAKWWSLNEFQQRKAVLEEAVAVHNEGRFVLSVPALLPQLEGIITDWILTKVPEDQVPFRQESKTKKFHQLALDGPPNGFTHRRVVESCIQFILDGPVLATFKKWFDVIDASFPNRNVVGHGRHDSALYTAENSIKIILLLDTIYYIISAPARQPEDIKPGE